MACPPTTDPRGSQRPGRPRHPVRVRDRIWRARPARQLSQPADPAEAVRQGRLGEDAGELPGLILISLKLNLFEMEFPPVRPRESGDYRRAKRRRPSDG